MTDFYFFMHTRFNVSLDPLCADIVLVAKNISMRNIVLLMLRNPSSIKEIVFTPLYALASFVKY